jgi:methyl-accepting chemotaxis protein
MKSQVQTVHSLVTDLHKQQQQGLLTEADTKKRAADLVRNLRFDEDNYFWIDTTEGVNVVLLGRITEGKNRFGDMDTSGKPFIQEIIKNGMQAGGGFTDYSFPKPNQKESLPKRSYSLLFQPYNWVIGTGSWVDDIDKLVADKATANNKNLNESLAYSVGIGFLGLLLTAAIALYLGGKIARPVTEVATSVQEIATGNLAVNDLTVNSRDEIGQLATSFNAMKQHLRELIHQASESASQVAAASEELTATADQAAVASSQVADSISEVAAGTDKQVKSVNAAANIVERMSSNIQEISGKISHVAELSIKTATAATTGKDAVESAISQMDTIERSVSGSAEVVTKLGERSKEIGQIVDTISGIAGQTNLLALNAAIEAARAGEAGRGFAVVAEEVRKLAEQSEEAAKQISSLIGEIQSDTTKAVISMQAGTQEVKHGTKVVVDAAEAFSNINTMVNSVSDQANEVAASVRQLTTDSQTIVGEVRAIEKISRDTSAETQTVSAATEEQSASLQQIAAASQSLAQMAEQLQTAVHRFHV